MPKIHNFIQSLDLAQYRVWLVDTDPTSRYFRLSQIPDTLTSGKNAFLITGAPELVATTDIKIELIDSNGNSVFLHPVKNYVEGLARIISIEIYADTAPGLATLTILGHIAKDADGNLPPKEFVNSYNVKWTKQILIAPERVNNTLIRLYKVPGLDVSELILPVFTTSPAISASVNTGTATISTYLNTPGIESSRINVVSLNGASECNRYMIGGLFTAIVNGISYTSSVVDVQNSSVFTVQDIPPTIAPSTASGYILQYLPTASVQITSEKRSYANIFLDNLTTISGQIARAKLYAKAINQTTDYQLLGDVTLNATELTVTSSLTTADARIKIGDIQNQDVISSYWQSGTVNGTSFTVSGSATYDSTRQLDSMHLTGPVTTTLSTVPTNYIGLKYPLEFEQGNEYYISGNILGYNPGNIYMRMDVYLSGSAFPPISEKDLGIKIASFVNSSNQSQTKFDLFSNIISPNSGSAILYFVIYSGDWYIKTIGVYSATEFGYNPDEIHTILPIVDRRLETLQFKIELFDANSNILPVDILSNALPITGSTLTVRGDGNRIDGSVNIGTTQNGSGITLTGNGYTGSTGPVYDLPAIYIGQGTYNDAGTPFFVASGSNTGGALFSLGNQLTWDGSVLHISGAIEIDNSAAISALQTTQSALQASQSALQAAQNGLYTSQSILNASSSALESYAVSLDNRIFTNVYGQIDRAPTASAGGLYLGSTYLGYFNSGMWRTYMDNAGHFFLTGSTGSNNYLAWDGTSLEIAGNINIVSGVTYTAIQTAVTSSNNAQASASSAQISASAVAGVASNAQTTASTALSIAQLAQLSASMAQGTASAANANIVAVSSSLAANIFTDATGRIVKTPSPSLAGLYLGSTNLGYYSGSTWKTYMANNGNFYLTGSNGSSNYLSWDGSILQIAGNINIVSGVTYTAIQTAVTSSNNAQASASNAQTIANAAQTSASAVAGVANSAQISASNAQTSAGNALTTASLANANVIAVSSSLSADIFTDATGKIVKTPSPSLAGLYLGSTNLGFYSGSSWKTYMDSSGHFYLTGSNGSSNYLSWDGSTLQIAGNINIVSGVTYTTIQTAVTSSNNAQASASAVAGIASNAQTTASNAQIIATAAQASASAVSGIATNAQTTASNAQTIASAAQTSASNAQASASAVAGIASNAQTTASNAQTIATAAQTTASNAQASASAVAGVAANALTTASAANANVIIISSSLSANIFTDSTGKIVKTPSPSLAGLYLGSTNLGYYSGSTWKTYMSNTGNFYLTGSNGSSNYLSWDGSTLQIAGNINIVSGVTYTTIQSAVTSSNNAQTSASTAISTANTANSNASSAQTSASTAISNAAKAQTSASTAITNAATAQTTANNAQSTASNALSNVATLSGSVFTNTTGLITKTPSVSSAGLYLGSTYMGYYNGSAWKTYMDNAGKFYLNGSGGNSLYWDGSSVLSITGSINATSGTISGLLSITSGGSLQVNIVTGDSGSLNIGLNTTSISIPVGYYIDGGGHYNEYTYGMSSYGALYGQNGQSIFFGKAGLAVVASGNVAIEAGSGTKSKIHLFNGWSTYISDHHTFVGMSSDSTILDLHGDFYGKGVTYTYQGIVGQYNASYRRRIYAMDPLYMGTTDSSGNISDFTTHPYYGLTFAYDSTSGGSNLTGFSYGHGVELNTVGTYRSFWGTSGFHHSGNLYIAGSGLIGGVFNCGTLTVTGGITATGDITAYYTSDRRLKNNIKLLESPLNKIKQISGVSYVWNDKSDYEGKQDVGVIAQEIEKVLPEAVVTRDTGYMAVRYEKIIPLLIEAIKELEIEIQLLKSK